MTREAAALLVADGQLPHTPTADQIYAAIGQGSRTTINDALKRWKAERAQADALADTLPPAIADAMRGLWAAAVEQGRAQFAIEREALVQERDNAVAAALEQTEAQQRAEARSAGLAQQIAALTASLAGAQHDMRHLETAKATTAAEATTLREALEQLRQAGAQERAETRAAHEALAAGHQATLAERDAAFCQGLDRATERLQQTEAHMLKQIDDARMATRRGETQPAKAHEQNAALKTELAKLRHRATRDQQDLTAAREALATAQARQADTEHRDAGRGARAHPDHSYRSSGGRPAARSPWAHPAASALTSTITRDHQAPRAPGNPFRDSLGATECLARRLGGERAQWRAAHRRVATHSGENPRGSAVAESFSFALGASCLRRNLPPC